MLAAKQILKQAVYTLYHGKCALTGYNVDLQQAHLIARHVIKDLGRFGILDNKYNIILLSAGVHYHFDRFRYTFLMGTALRLPKERASIGTAILSDYGNYQMRDLRKNLADVPEQVLPYMMVQSLVALGLVVKPTEVIYMPPDLSPLQKHIWVLENAHWTWKELETDFWGCLNQIPKDLVIKVTRKTTTDFQYLTWGTAELQRVNFNDLDAAIETEFVDKFYKDNYPIRFHPIDHDPPFVPPSGAENESKTLVPRHAQKRKASPMDDDWDRELEKRFKRDLTDYLI